MNAPTDRVFGIFSIGRQVLTWDGRIGKVVSFNASRTLQYEVLCEQDDQGSFYRAESLELQDITAPAPMESEMLAVLKKLRRGDLHQRVRYLYDEAQAVIAKAEGK